VFFNGTGAATGITIDAGNPLEIEILYSAFEQVADPIFRVDFFREGRIYTGYSTAYDDQQLPVLLSRGRILLRIGGLFVPPGIYSVSVTIAETYEHNLLDTHHLAYPLHVLRSRNLRGEVELPHSWFHTSDTVNQAA
jgi:hypothetical protein